MDATSQPTGKSYEIASLNDLVACYADVQPHRRHVLMHELEQALSLFAEMARIDDDGVAFAPQSLTWTDDDLRDVNINIITEALEGA